MKYVGMRGIFDSEAFSKRKRKASQEHIVFLFASENQRWFSSGCYGKARRLFLASLENTKSVFQRMVEKRKKKGLLKQSLKKRKGLLKKALIF